MKNILSLFFLSLFVHIVSAQTTERTWNYPVKPGSGEWKQLQSNEEMVNACQIPEHLLSSLSTEKLTELCLQYPLIYDVFAFDNINNGLDKLYSDFNGIRELYKRKNVSDFLINQYIQKMQTFSFLDEKSTEYEKGKFIVDVSLLEVLLSRFVTKNDASYESYKNVLRILVTGYESKFKYTDYFKGVGFRSNIYSRAQVISILDNQSFEKLTRMDKNRVLVSGMADEQGVRFIDELSYKLIK